MENLCSLDLMEVNIFSYTWKICVLNNEKYVFVLKKRQKIVTRFTFLSPWNIRGGRKTVPFVHILIRNYISGKK